jgi:hypothetical protein
MVLSGHDKHDDIDFLLTGKDGSGLETVAVETGSIDQGDVDDAVVEERFRRGPGVCQINLDHLLSVFVVGDEFLELGDSAAGKGGFIVDIVLDALPEDMDLLSGLVFCSIVDFAEGGSAGLLVDRHDLATEESIDKGGFTGIQITSDENLGRGVLDAESEFVDMGHGCSNAAIKEIGDGGLFELVDEGGGSGSGVGTEFEVEFEDIEL